jgi:hypothetical protein
VYGVYLQRKETKKRTTAMFLKVSRPRGSGEEDPRFMGKKARRRSSAYKRFLGDYLGLENNSCFLKMMAAKGDAKVLFSDVVVKINKRYKMQERVLVITDHALYSLTTRNYKRQRRIAFDRLTSIHMSTFADNYITLHCADDRDYLLICNRKTEMVMSLIQAVFLIQQKTLPVLFSNACDWVIEPGDVRELRFIQEDSGVLMQILNRKDGASAARTLSKETL